MNAQHDVRPESQIPTLIAELGDTNGLVRQQARLSLVYLGQESVPALLQALASQSATTRWEAVKALSLIHHPETTAAFVNMLRDNNEGVRWAAAEGLIEKGRDSLRPLLEGFTLHFDEPWFRHGFHHILHEFKNKGLLNPEEIALYRILAQQNSAGIETGWTGEAAWAAEKALEALDRQNL